MAESNGALFKPGENIFMTVAGFLARFGLIPAWFFSLLRFFQATIDTIETWRTGREIVTGLGKLLTGWYHPARGGHVPRSGGHHGWAWLGVLRDLFRKGAHLVGQAYDAVFLKGLQWLFRQVHVTVDPLIVYAAIAAICAVGVAWYFSRRGYERLMHARKARLAAQAAKKDVSVPAAMGGGALIGLIIAGPLGALIGGIIGSVGGAVADGDAAHAEKAALDAELAARAAFFGIIAAVVCSLLLFVVFWIIYATGGGAHS